MVEVAARVRVPVLLLAGGQDALFTPRTLVGAAAPLPEHRVVTLAGCGHSPYLEDAPTWNEHVLAFTTAQDRLRHGGQRPPGA